MKGSVRDIDRGFDDLMRSLGQVGQGSPRVFVGILQDKGAEFAEGGGITLAGYAAANEFGTDTIPERSFLRSTLDENRGRYNEGLDKAVDALIEGVGTGVPGAGLRMLEHSLGQLGVRVSNDVKKKIRDLRDPPNAESTLERKYPGENPLIHTGRMRSAISFQVDMTGSTNATKSAPKKARARKGSRA